MDEKNCHVCFMQYKGDVCPQCGNQEFSVLASDYQQTINALKAENARLREGLEKIADNTQIRNHPDGSEVILGHGSLEEISWDYIDDLHTIATHALNEREE